MSDLFFYPTGTRQHGYAVCREAPDNRLRPSGEPEFYACKTPRRSAIVCTLEKALVWLAIQDKVWLRCDDVGLHLIQ